LPLATSHSSWRYYLVLTSRVGFQYIKECLPFTFLPLSADPNLSCSLNNMHLGLCLSVVFMTYVILTDSLAPSSNLSFSQNLFDNADTSAEASLVSMPSSPEPSGSARLTAGPEPKDYTVIPLVPTKVTAVSEFIQTFAVKDSVKTIIDQYRREYNNVLYWSFKATKTAAKALEENLGHDVGTQR